MPSMITAFLTMNAESDRIPALPDELLKITGVTEVYSIVGDFDLVALVRVKEAEDLAGVGTERFTKLNAITRRMTLIAFKSYSNCDLENMFQIGFRG